MSADALIAVLDAEAQAARAAEESFRREWASRIAELERERAFAFRRAGFIRMVTAAMAGADSPEIAVALGLAAFRARLGWDDDTPARAAVLERFVLVLTALAPSVDQAEDAEQKGAEPPDPAAALAAFELWYAQTREISFWVLFENPFPDTPRTDY